MSVVELFTSVGIVALIVGANRVVRFLFGED
jgi:hypothetical protein